MKTMTKEKVFCSDCVLYHEKLSTSFDNGYWPECHHEKNTKREDTFKQRETVYKKSASVINANNDCKWHTAKSDVKVTLSEDVPEPMPPETEEYSEADVNIE